MVNRGGLPLYHLPLPRPEMEEPEDPLGTALSVLVDLEISGDLTI